MIVVPPIRNRKINPSGKSCLAFEGAVDGLSTSAYLGGKTALISSGWTGDCCKTATTPVLGLALTLSTAGSCAMAFSTDEAQPLAGHPLNMNDLFHGRLNWKCNVLKKSATPTESWALEPEEVRQSGLWF